MKRLILFTAILLGLAAIMQAQTTEKVKTKIEGQGFKKKIKTEGESQKVLTSMSAHPAYVHHNTTARRHISSGTRHVSHVKPTYTHVAQHKSAHLAHYKKMKRIHKNGEYKIKYKT